MEIEAMGVMHFGSARHVQSVVAVPMRTSNRIIGMISAQSYMPYAYETEEQALLEMLAAHAATAIENGRLFESEQRRRQEAENLRQAATAISSTLDPDQVLTEVLKALKQVIPYDHASVFMQEEDRLRLAIGQGFPENKHIVGTKFPVDELYNQIADTQFPIILEDAQMDVRFQKWGDTIDIHGWTAIPLMSRGCINFEPKILEGLAYPCVKCCSDEMIDRILEFSNRNLAL